MAGFGMGGSVSTTSGVGQRAENEARQEEREYRQEAESIPTGMGALPSIAKGVAPTLGAVVQESNNMNSSDTLGQVLQEASQTGLLSETESTLIGNQLGTPEGNDRARTMLGKTLPMRRADQKAIEFIQGKASDRILEIKQLKEPEKRQALINKLVQDLQLEAAESEDEVTRTAIMKRVEDMFGIKSGANSDWEARENLRQKHKLEYLAQQGVTWGGLDKAKSERKKKFMIEHKTPFNAYQKARDLLPKKTEGAASLKAINDMYSKYLDENGEYDLIGFSKGYFGDIAKMTEQARNTEEQSPKFKKALKQQQEFMTFLTAHLKAMSGTAVTRSEAVKVLIAFGLGDYADELSPDTSPREFENTIEKFAVKLFKNRYSTLTPQKIVDGLNSLATTEQKKVDNVRDNYMFGLSGTEYEPLLEGQLEAVSVPRFANATTKYDLDKIPDAGKLRDATKNAVTETIQGVDTFVFGDPKKDKIDPSPKVNPKNTATGNVETKEERRERIKSFRLGNRK